MTQSYYWASADDANPFIIKNDTRAIEAWQHPEPTLRTLRIGTVKRYHQISMVVVCLMIAAKAAHALDHDNLDPNRPIAIEDAYVIPKGEIGVEGGMTFNDRKEGKSRFGFQPQIIYGAFENTQIEIMTGLLTGADQRW